MTQPFRFRYTNQLVGGFVLLILLALAAGVFVAGHAQHWFEAVYTIEATFPPEGTFGLQRGAEVHILGTPVGTVDQIRVEKDDSIHALINVRGDFVRFIRTDSIAVIKRKFGLAGDAYLEISMGTGPSLPMEPMPTLSIRRDTELMETITGLVERLETAVIPAVEEATRTVREYRELGEQLRSEEGDVQSILGHIREILRGLEKGEGAAGRVLRDPTLAEEIQEILSRIRLILENVHEATARLPVLAETVEGEMRDVPGTVLQGRAALQEAEELMAGIQRHWLLRRYIHTDYALETIPVERIVPSEEW